MDNPEVIIFNNMIDGNVTRSSVKHKYARMTICLPEEIAKENIKPILDDFRFFHIAIPNRIMKEIKEKEKKLEQKVKEIGDIGEKEIEDDK